MQHDSSYTEIDMDSFLFAAPKKKRTKERKWREIEALKARQQLTKELYDIDQSFELRLTDLV